MQDPQRLYVRLLECFGPVTYRAVAIMDEDTVRPPWRHGELGRNDLAACELIGTFARSE